MLAAVPSVLKLDHAIISEQGGRDNNEDACGMWTSHTLGCWVLADGLGGYEGGEIASQLTVRAILSDIANDPCFSSATINELMHLANEAISARKVQDYGLSRMASTAVVLLIDRVNATALWGHVGDSRLYLVRDNQILMRTRDHSLLQRAADMGAIEPSAAFHPRLRSILTHALGGDVFSSSIEEAQVVLLPGDAFLLCSDGWWELLNEHDMIDALNRNDSAERWLACLEQLVLERAQPRHDNYSAVAVRIVGQ